MGCCGYNQHQTNGQRQHFDFVVHDIRVNVMNKVIGMNCFPIYGTAKNIKLLPALANDRRLFGNTIQRVALFVIV